MTHAPIIQPLNTTRTDIIGADGLRRRKIDAGTLVSPTGPLNETELAMIAAWQTWDAGQCSPRSQRWGDAANLWFAVESADFMLCRIEGYPQGEAIAAAKSFQWTSSDAVDSPGIRREVWRRVLEVVNKWVPEAPRV